MTREEKIRYLDEYCMGTLCGGCPDALHHICVADAFDELPDDKLDLCLSLIDATEPLEPFSNSETSKPEPTIREAVLAAAVESVCGHRVTDYGKPEDNFGTIAELWSAYKCTFFSPVDVAMMMALLKVARIKAGATEDSFVDLAGYAACAAECAEKERTNG